MVLTDNIYVDGSRLMVFVECRAQPAFDGENFEFT